MRKNLLLFLFLLGTSGAFSQQYCISYMNNIEPISRVVFAGIDNSSSPYNTQYHIEYFTNLTANVETNGTYQITVEGNTNGGYTNYITVFIDWNHNNNLDDFGEVYQIGTLYTSSGTDGQQAADVIGVPPSAYSGPTLMRVIKNFGDWAMDACGTYDYGQAEDYTVIVNAQNSDDYCMPQIVNVQPITQVLFAGIQKTSSASLNQPEIEYFLNNTANVLIGNSYTISLKGNTDGSATNYFTAFIDWNQDGDLSDFNEVYQIGSITNSSGTDSQQISAQILVPFSAVTGTTRLRIIKSFGSYPTNPCLSYSYGQVEDYSVNINDTGSDEYCSLIISGVEPITKVLFAGIDNPSPNSLFAPHREDFTNLTGSVAKGSSYTISVEGNTNGNYVNYFTAFIDWNQNNFLDDSGEIYPIGSISNSTGSDAKKTTSLIAVPPTAALGDTRMRIIKNYEASPTDPCGTFSHGQAEDYTLNVTGASQTTYCTNTISSTQPITKVVFAGISNQTPADINQPGSEDFTALTANVIKGNNYTISIKGNTNGNFSNNFVVFIDWNKNNILSDPGEIFPMGFIANSTGVDLQQTTGTIAVPQTALTGITRMRVLKKFGGSAEPTNPCENFGFGQVEDYSVNITAPLGIDILQNITLNHHYNADSDILLVSASENISEITVFSISGRLLIRKNPQSKETSLHMATLADGIYIATINCNGKSKNIKLIKN